VPCRSFQETSVAWLAISSGTPSVLQSVSTSISLGKVAATCLSILIIILDGRMQIDLVWNHRVKRLFASGGAAERV
jgi:hypothetical protein